MNTESQQDFTKSLAQEARWEFERRTQDVRNYDPRVFEEVMLTTIEKAYEQGWNNCSYAPEGAQPQRSECNCVRMEFESHRQGCPLAEQPPATEEQTRKRGDASCHTTLLVTSNAAPTVQPAGAATDRVNESLRREWTEARVEQCLANHGAKGLAKAINAALAAERKQWSDAAEVELALHQRQLATVREKHAADKGMFQATKETLLEQLKEYGQQLLAAQAAIAEHERRWSNYEGEKCHIMPVDLSALKEHDAEVRRPLVHLLAALCAWDDAGFHRLLEPILRERIDDALAKAKEGK
jgi:hypothetical protein